MKSSLKFILSVTLAIFSLSYVSAQEVPSLPGFLSEKNIAFTKVAANQGNVDAMLSLATIYSIEEKLNIPESVKWYSKAAEAGSSEAMHMLGIIHLSTKTSYHDAKLGFSWMQKAALAGTSEAFFKLAELYANGTGTDINEEQARYWFEKANAIGINTSESRLPNPFEGGDIELTKIAANQGDLTAMQILASWNLDLSNSDGKHKEAIKWHTMAAEAGSIESMFMLGLMYRPGDLINSNDIIIDETKAFYWLTQAAEKGHGFAQAELARMYADGIGTEKDEKEAIKWLTKAKEQGLEPTHPILPLK